MMRGIHATIAVCAVALYAGGVQAADVFTVDAEITELDGPGYNVLFGTSNAEELFETLEQDNLTRLVAQQSGGRFNGDEIIAADLNFRGVPMTIDFTEVGAPELLFAIPGIEFSRVFDEQDTREGNIDDLIEFLKTNEDGIASQLSAELARSSPSDPVAGNPGSMQSRMVDTDFKQAFTQKVSQIWGCGMSASAPEKVMLAKAGFGCVTDVADLNFRMPAIEVAQLGGPASDAANLGLYDDYFSRINRVRGENKLTLGLDYAQVSAKAGGSGIEHESSVLSLPLSYTVVLNNDPRKRFIVRMPISLIDTEGASTYQVSLGLAYNHPVTNAWSLTPSVGYSAAGSEDLASASALASFSLASSYTVNLGSWALNIGNMIGNYSTQKITLGDYESDPGISNTVFTNGLLISGPSSLLANDLVVEYFVTDTRYTGDDLFTDNSQEVGVNFGKLNTTGEVVTSFIKGSVSYTMASGDNGNEADMLRLSLIFKF